MNKDSAAPEDKDYAAAEDKDYAVAQDKDCTASESTDCAASAKTDKPLVDAVPDAIKTPVHEVAPAKAAPAKHLPAKSAKPTVEAAVSSAAIAPSAAAVVVATPLATAASTSAIDLPMPVTAPAAQLEAVTPVPVGPTKSSKGTVPAVAAKASVHDAKKPAVQPASAPATGQVAASEHEVRTVPAAAKSGELSAPAASLQSGSMVAATAAIGSNVPVAAIKTATVTHSAAATSTVANTPVENADSKTLVATPNVLEVGIASGTHGWLRVRAELGQMGEVTASMVASSAGAADSLHRDLPGISAYLKSEAIGVTSLAVHATGQTSGAQDAAMSFGAQTGSGGRGRGAQDQASETAPDRGSSAGSDAIVSGMPFGFGSMDLPAAVYSGGSGSWLSVRV